jgi:hypothetical protein
MRLFKFNIADGKYHLKTRIQYILLIRTMSKVSGCEIRKNHISYPKKTQSLNLNFPKLQPPSAKGDYKLKILKMKLKLKNKKK